MSQTIQRVFFLASVFCTSVLAQRDCAAARLEFVLDPVHTQIVFQISHAGFSDSTGLLLRPEGKLVLDPANCAGAEVEIRMQAQNVEFNDPAWNKAVRGKSYFNTEQFPELRFSGTRCQMLDARHALLEGELTLLGQRRTLQLKVEFNKRGNHPYTLKDTIGFNATTTLKRSDFGMNATLKTVGDEVRIRIAVEAIRVKSASRRMKR